MVFTGAATSETPSSRAKKTLKDARTDSCEAFPTITDIGDSTRLIGLLEH